MRGRSILLAALLLLAVAVAVGIGRLTDTASDGRGAVVLVSGRDDHGLVQQASVPLVTEPEGSDVSGHLDDGTFARVLEARGTWLHVRAVADPAVGGWIDDFYLRSRAVLHDAQQVTFEDAEAGPPVRILVRPVVGNAEPFWVEEEHLTEVGADLEPHEH